MKKISLKLIIFLVLVFLLMSVLLFFIASERHDGVVTFFVGLFGVFHPMLKAIVGITITGLLLGIINALFFKVPGFPFIESENKLSVTLWIIAGLLSIPILCFIGFLVIVPQPSLGAPVPPYPEIPLYDPR